MILAAMVVGFVLSIAIGLRNPRSTATTYVWVVALTAAEIAVMLYAVYSMDQPPVF